MKFSDLGVTTDVVVGKGIEMDELFGQHILIEKTIIKPTNFPGKNSSGLRMQMQVCFPTWLPDGSWEKGEDGNPKGQRRSCFTGSDVLIGAIQENNVFQSSIKIVNPKDCRFLTCTLWTLLLSRLASVFNLHKSWKKF